MRARVATLVLAAALAACSRSAPDAPSRPVGNTAGASTPATADAAVAPDAGEACVAACVQARQMVAMSIDAIRAECVRTCAADPSAFAPPAP